VVVGLNRSLQDDIGILGEDPYGAGWLLDVDCGVGLEKLPGILSSTEQSERLIHDRTRLRLEAERCMAGDRRVGPTLADGGERLSNLRAALGPQRFRELVISILDQVGPP
jgi:hypothetical protein